MGRCGEGGPRIADAAESARLHAARRSEEHDDEAEGHRALHQAHGKLPYLDTVRGVANERELHDDLKFLGVEERRGGARCRRR